MPAKVVIGVWQGRSVNAEPDANLARAAKVVDEASAAGCDFVCLPESFVSGYGTREIIEAAKTRRPISSAIRRSIDTPRKKLLRVACTSRSYQPFTALLGMLPGRASLIALFDLLLP